MSSIYLSDQLKTKLIRAARKRGFAVERGRQSQLAEYIAYLVRLDEQTGPPRKTRRTLEQALGLLERPGQSAPSDADIDALLAERRLQN